MTKGKKKKAALRKVVSRFRQRLIRKNWRHAGESHTKPKYKNLQHKMSKSFRQMFNRTKKLRDGGKGLRLHRKFWGIPYPTRIQAVRLPGQKNKRVTLVGMGRASVRIADGPKGRSKSSRMAKGAGAMTPDGRQIMILSGRSAKGKPKLKFVGWASETHYIPTRSMERAGSFKKNTHWVHKQGEEGGTWPKVWKDQAGNLIYARGSYRVGKWIRD